jgi:CheY-like chemotaxis protein
MVRRIICIDDDPVCLMLEKMVIKHSKITDEVHLVSSVEAALSLLETLRVQDASGLSNGAPTLVFLDINMPVLDGFDFLDALNSSGGELVDKVKVVMLSSSIDDREIKKAKEYKSVIDFISKPLTVSAVRSLSYQ